MSAAKWDTPAAKLTLSPSEVHIWRTGLDLPKPTLNALASTLSPDERQRASSFRFDRHRDRYITARGAIRSLLGRYLACDPHEIQFEYGAHGKPEVFRPKRASRLRFNLAHSADLALFALCHERRIGIDLERKRALTDMAQLVSRNFSPRESATWRSLPQRERESAFFNCWVRKEAFVKAVGEGLSYPLQDFDVTLSPGDTPDLTAVSGDTELARKWSLFEIRVAPDYAAAMVVEGRGWQLRFLQIDKTSLP